MLAWGIRSTKEEAYNNSFYNDNKYSENDVVEKVGLAYY